MYTVSFDVSRNEVTIDAHTLADLRFVARARIQEFNLVSEDSRGIVFNESGSPVRLLVSDTIRTGADILSPPTALDTRPTMWQSVEQFINVSIRTHVEKLNKSNLAPLNQQVKYTIVEKDRMIRPSSLIQLSERLRDLKVLSATHKLL